MSPDPLSPAGYIDWTPLTASLVAPGIEGRSVSGDQMSVSAFDLRPGAEVPRHAHLNEEFGIVVSGRLRLRCGSDAERVLAAGDSFLIDSNVEHSAVALDDGCRLIECYSPPRIPAPMEEEIR